MKRARDSGIGRAHAGSGAPLLRPQNQFHRIHNEIVVSVLSIDPNAVVFVYSANREESYNGYYFSVEGGRICHQLNHPYYLRPMCAHAFSISRAPRRRSSKCQGEEKRNAGNAVSPPVPAYHGGTRPMRTP